MLNKSNRIEYISLASVVSAIAVIYLHANGCFWNFSPNRYWFTANIIESVFYFAVPIFFMISGAMLIDFNKKYDLKQYFSKRIYKTVIPFIIWSFIGLLIQIYYLKTVNVNDVTIGYIVNGLLSGRLVGVYWFFIPLFLTYLAIPVFAYISDNNKKDILIYTTSAAFILNCLIPFIIKIFNIQVEYSLSLTVCSGVLFFSLVGYLLHKYELSRKYRLVLYVLAICGLLMHIIGTYELSIAAGKIIDTYKGYTNLPATLYSIGVFVFIKYDLVKMMKFDLVSKFVHFTDFYTFGIYLIHWYLLEFLIKTFNIVNTSIIYRLFAPIVVLIMSIIIIYLIRKIPIIKNILP